ncbi:hypothetical protein BT69DRAFT_311325 [Atractiella rhizophila]|nr:hypothetical protein BT69DRAFT_311325 [Atractiella rhizophila]
MHSETLQPITESPAPLPSTQLQPAPPAIGSTSNSRTNAFLNSSPTPSTSASPLLSQPSTLVRQTSSTKLSALFGSSEPSTPQLSPSPSMATYSPLAAFLGKSPASSPLPQTPTFPDLPPSPTPPSPLPSQQPPLKQAEEHSKPPKKAGARTPVPLSLRAMDETPPASPSANSNSFFAQQQQETSTSISKPPPSAFSAKAPAVKEAKSHSEFHHTSPTTIERDQEEEPLTPVTVKNEPRSLRGGDDVDDMEAERVEAHKEMDGNTDGRGSATNGVSSLEAGGEKVAPTLGRGAMSEEMEMGELSSSKRAEVPSKNMEDSSQHEPTALSEESRAEMNEPASLHDATSTSDRKTDPATVSTEVPTVRTVIPPSHLEQQSQQRREPAQDTSTLQENQDMKVFRRRSPPAFQPVDEVTSPSLSDRSKAVRQNGHHGHRSSSSNGANGFNGYQASARSSTLPPSEAKASPPSTMSNNNSQTSANGHDRYNGNQGARRSSTLPPSEGAMPPPHSTSSRKPGKPSERYTPQRDQIAGQLQAVSQKLEPIARRSQDDYQRPPQPVTQPDRMAIRKARTSSMQPLPPGMQFPAVMPHQIHYDPRASRIPANASMLHSGFSDPRQATSAVLGANEEGWNRNFRQDTLSTTRPSRTSGPVRRPSENVVFSSHLEMIVAEFSQPIFSVIISHLGYADFRPLKELNRSIRQHLHANCREVVLTRFLGPVGYRPQWMVMRQQSYRQGSMPPRNEDIDITLRDLDAFKAGSEYTMSELTLFARQHSAQPLPLTFYRMLKAYTRAYSRIAMYVRNSPLTERVPVQSGAPPPPITTPIWKPGRAASLRVWVPTKTAWMSDQELVECEREVYRAGVWSHVRKGDMIWNVGCGDFGNEGKLLFDGKYLRDLSYVFEASGHLPSWVNMFTFPPSFYHNVIHSSTANPVIYLRIYPFLAPIRQSLSLVQDRLQVNSAQGSHSIKKFVYRAAFDIAPGTILNVPSRGAQQEGERIVDAWAGQVMVETEGTTEHANLLLSRCSVPDNTPWRIIRERSRPGKLWISPIFDNEKLA